MNLFSMLKNVAFMMDAGPSENSPLWKKLDAYHSAKREPETASTASELCSLEDVLQDSDLLSFLQHKHNPLIQFLTEPEHLEAILRYITSCPSGQEELSQKSTKILCHNVSDVRDQVFSKTPDNLNILFGFEGDSLESPRLVNLDALHSGLLNQVVVKFLNTQNWCMVDYFANTNAFQQNPNQLLCAPGLLITLVDNNFCYPDSDIAKWLNRINLMNLLVTAFNGSLGEKMLLGASEVLANIVQNQSPLMQQIENSSDVVTSLFDSIFVDQNPQRELAIAEALTIFNLLAIRYQSTPCNEIPLALKPILDNISRLNEILAEQSDEKAIVNSSGTFVPFGMTRMRVVELYKSLLQIRSEPIDNALLESEMFPCLFSAFFRHKWNNILQTAVMGMCRSIFDTPSGCAKMLQRTQIVSQVSQLLLEDYRRKTQDEVPSPIYGFLVQFREKFFELYRDQNIRETVFDKCNEWKEYIDSDPEAKAELNKRPPGIFDNYEFVLDISNDSYYSEIKNLIEENGGTIAEAVTSSTYCIVSPDEDIVNRSAKVAEALRVSKPVVQPEFVTKSIETKQLQNYSFFPADWNRKKPEVEVITTVDVPEINDVEDQMEIDSEEITTTADDNNENENNETDMQDSNNEAENQNTAAPAENEDSEQLPTTEETV